MLPLEGTFPYIFLKEQKEIEIRLFVLKSTSEKLISYLFLLNCLGESFFRQYYFYESQSCHW